MNFPSKQRGIGWFGLMIHAIAYGTLGLLAVKTAPMVFNEMKIARAIKTAAKEPMLASGGQEQVNKILWKFWSIESIEYMDFKEVKVRNTANGRVLAYDYWAQTNIFENVFVSIHFTREEPIKAGVE